MMGEIRNDGVEVLVPRKTTSEILIMLARRDSVIAAQSRRIEALEAQLAAYIGLERIARVLSEDHWIENIFTYDEHEDAETLRIALARLDEVKEPK